MIMGVATVKEEKALMKQVRWMIFVSLIFIANIIFFFFSVFNKDTAKALYGSTIDAAKPVVEVDTIMSGDFQHMFDDWYLENFPYRYYFIKAYNSIMFCLKQENNRIIVGENGYLYGEDYIDSYTKESEWEGRDESYMSYAEKVSYIQDYLNCLGKKFIYIVSPSKAVVYPEYIPNEYMKLCREDRMSNLEYEMLAFEQYGVEYINANLDMYELKSKGIQPYYKQGIHWNCVASSIFLKRVDDKYDIIPGNMDVTFNEVESTAESYIYGENDLWHLVNGFQKPLTETYYNVSIRYDNDEEYDNNIFILGTSFSGIYNEIFNGALADYKPKYHTLTAYRYLDAAYRYYDGQCEEVSVSHNPAETNILDDIMKNDIIIFENNSSYIPDSYLLVVDYLYENLK